LLVKKEMPAAALLAGGWQSSPTEPAPPILRITVTLIQVDAVVADSSGRHIPDLHKEDFQVLQDGQPQKITWFAYVAGPPPAAKPSAATPKPAKDQAPVPLAPPAPLAAGQVQRTVALVVDGSSSVSPVLPELHHAAYDTLSQLKPEDQVALYAFAAHPERLVDLTTDRKSIAESIMGIGSAGGTNIADALHEAIDYLGQEARDRRHAVRGDPRRAAHSANLRQSAQFALRRGDAGRGSCFPGRWIRPWRGHVPDRRHWHGRGG